MRCGRSPGLLLAFGLLLPMGANAAIGRDVPSRCIDQSGVNVDLAAMAREFDAGAPPLFHAIGRQRQPALKKLLAGGADPNLCHAGVSPMLLAVGAGDAPAVKLLAKAGARLDRPRDSNGATPLHLAASLGKFGVAAMLLGLGADAKLLDDGANTVLHSLALQPAPSAPAQRALQVRLAGQLIERGVALDAVNARGSSALMMAIAAGNIDLMAGLLEHGADPALRNGRGETALAYARRLGHAALEQHLQRHLATTRTSARP